MSDGYLLLLLSLTHTHVTRMYQYCIRDVRAARGRHGFDLSPDHVIYIVGRYGLNYGDGRVRVAQQAPVCDEG